MVNGRVLIEGLTISLKPLRRRSSLVCLYTGQRAGRLPSKSNHVVSLMITTLLTKNTEGASIPTEVSTLLSMHDGVRSSQGGKSYPGPRNLHPEATLFWRYTRSLPSSYVLCVHTHVKSSKITNLIKIPSQQRPCFTEEQHPQPR